MTHASCFSLPTPLKPSDVQTPRSSTSASLSRLKQQLADQTATLSQCLAYQTGFKGCRNIMEILGYNFTWRVEETKHFSAPLKHKHFCPLKHKQLEFFVVAPFMTKICTQWGEVRTLHFCQETLHWTDNLWEKTSRGKKNQFFSPLRIICQADT